jgi:hypothetical protein
LGGGYTFAAQAKTRDFPVADYCLMGHSMPIHPSYSSEPRACYHPSVADQELKWWHVRWRLAGRAVYPFALVSGKIIGTLGLLAAIGYGALYLISPWLGSRQMGRFDPRLNLVPASLPIKVQAPLSGPSIDCCGFTFRLPDEVAKTFRNDEFTRVRFRNGGFLMSQNVLQAPSILERTINEKSAQGLLKKTDLASKYSLMEAAMWATPEQAKWWRFHTSANERVGYLLVTKMFVISQLFSRHSSTVGPIYAIGFGEFRGFQVGNPDVAPFEAYVDLFDAADRHFAFQVTGPEGHGPVLTQTEINAIVASIQPPPGH